MKESNATERTFQGLLGRFDDLLIADGTAGLHDGLDARIDKHLSAIGEREERVGSGNRTGGAIGAVSQCVGAVDGQMAGIHTVDLAHADADRGLIVGQ